MAALRQSHGRAGGRARGRLVALALIAVAVVPLLALLLAPREGPERPVALMAPLAHGPATDGAAVAPETASGDSSDLPPPDTDAPADAPAAPSTAPNAADTRATAGPALVPPPAARAAAPSGPERWRGIPSCPRERITGGQYNRCLYEATRTSEQAMEAALTNAFSVIEARGDLQGNQRNRWKTMLDEAQSRFLLFRNLDCQGVAPFEGPRGIGNFEQRALCLIDANTRRASELRARYVASAPVANARGPQGPQDRPGTWTHAVSPAVD